MPTNHPRPFTPQFLYVLELEHGAIYVGITAGLERRLRKHVAGFGADWTRLNKPIRLLHSEKLRASTITEARQTEDQYTIELMRLYGWQNVRGGTFHTPFPKALRQTMRACGYCMDDFDQEKATARLADAAPEPHADLLKDLR